MIEGAQPPVGTVVAYAGPVDTLASRRALLIAGWLVCDGRATVQLDTAPELFRAIGVLYGDGPQHGFKIPDYRGRFLRVLADDESQDPGLRTRAAPPGGTNKSPGSTQGDMVQLHQHDAASSVATATIGQGTPTAAAAGPAETTSLLAPDGTALDGKETRPKNVYIVLLIRFTSRPGLHNLVIDLGMS